MSETSIKNKPDTLVGSGHASRTRGSYEQATQGPPLSEHDVARFRRDGFLRLTGFFHMEEVGLLRRVLERDPLFWSKVRTGLDQSGNSVEIWITSQLGDDVLGAFVRSRHLVEAAEQLIGEEVYHWHHKMTLKSPRVGGAWEWHQDYGYWYDYGCLFPDLVSCMIAVDAATVGNGCLEVVRGAHRMGRLDTARKADQTSIASEERLRIILQDLECVPCELEPGDTLFFHANTLHRSEVNRSEDPRWALICVYNARSNTPRPVPPTRPHDPDAPPTLYTPLDRWPRERIREVALRQLRKLKGKMRPVFSGRD